MSKNKSKWKSEGPQQPIWPDYACKHWAECLRVEGEDLHYSAGRRGFKILNDEEHRFMLETPELPSYTAYKKDWSALASSTFLCSACSGFWQLVRLSPEQLANVAGQQADQEVEAIEEELIAA